MSETMLCWWCQQRPANSGEHKFKASDLRRMKSDEHLVWGNGVGETREIRNVTRDRYGVLKFPKSMCAQCNNARSQPFDLVYDQYADHRAQFLTRGMPSVALEQVYGTEHWAAKSLDLARYFIKHFGCELVAINVPVPDSLRLFLDGATDMPDVHLALVTTDIVHNSARHGLTMSPAFADLHRETGEVLRCVLASYLGSVGVRLEWRRDGIPDEERSQFFHFPNPLLNYFTDEAAVVAATPREPGLITRFLRWVSTPSGSGT